MDRSNLEETLEAKMQELTGRVRPRIEEAKRRLQSMRERAMSFIKDHPAASLLGASAIGFLLARLARRPQS